VAEHANEREPEALKRSGACDTVARRWTSLEHVISLVDGRWTIALLSELVEGARRYQDFDGALEDISHKVLTDTLRRAERDGLIARHLDPNLVETATVYELTDLGRSLDEPLGPWNDGWIATGPGSMQHAATGTDDGASSSRHLRVPQGSLQCRFHWCIAGNTGCGGPSLRS
jgi:DNA-binding HxlR family transcriptional regulator